MTTRCLWEILVPTVRNNGKPFRTRYHRVWDKKVREISRGLSILTPLKGEWISEEQEVFRERMIPVRIPATEKEINEIVDMTLEYYEQNAVLAYKIANDFILRKKL